MNLITCNQVVRENSANMHSHTDTRALNNTETTYIIHSINGKHAVLCEQTNEKILQCKFFAYVYVVWSVRRWMRAKRKKKKRWEKCAAQKILQQLFYRIKKSTPLFLPFATISLNTFLPKIFSCLFKNFVQGDIFWLFISSASSRWISIFLTHL